MDKTITPTSAGILVTSEQRQINDLKERVEHLEKIKAAGDQQFHILQKKVEKLEGITRSLIAHLHQLSVPAADGAGVVGRHLVFSDELRDALYQLEQDFYNK